MEEYWQSNDEWRGQPRYQPTRRMSWVQRIFSRDRKRLQLLLFLLTFLSTYFVGGPVYSIAIMSILLAHEMGHYLMCRHHHIPATLPFFIPMPFTIFGTMGAVIAMHRVIPNRRALFDVGVAGPLAGLVLAFPAIVIGLHHSTIIDPKLYSEATITMGEPLMFQLLRYLVIGPVPEHLDVLVHPMAFAGWVGLFVTALNLLPVGQLDGGHIAYALFGKNSKYIYLTAFIVFAISAFFFPGWILMLFLLAFFFYKHPPPLDDFTPIDSKRKALGIVMFVIFILSFTPVPFKF